MRDESACLFGEDGIGDEQLVLETFLYADSGTDGIFEGVQTEAVRGVSVQHVVEKLAALLDLQIVRPVHRSLVDCAPQIRLLRLAFPAADEHVKREDVIDGKFLGVHSLFKGLFVDDDLVAIDQMFFQLVREDALEGVHFVGVADLLDHFRDLVVDVAGFYESQRGLGRFVGSQNDISLLAGYLSVLVGLHNDSMRDECGKAVNMHAELNLDEVSFLDVC